MFPLLAPILIPSVKLENRVARLPDLVAELVSEGNANLAVSKELANELVYVRSGPRTVDAWLPLIAEAVAAEWDDDGRTRRLTRSPAFKRRLEAEENKAHTEIWLKSVRAAVGTPDPEPLSGEGAQRVIDTAANVRKAVWARTPNMGAKLIDAQKDLIPSWRLMRRLLTRETISQFVTVPLGEVGYWSSIKRPMRRLLTVNPSLLKEYNRERALLIQTLSAGKTRDQFREAAASTSDYWHLTLDAKPATELTVTVQRYNASMAIVHAELQDADGNPIEHCGPTISLTFDRSTWPDYSSLQTHRFPNPAMEELVKGLAHESEAFRTLALDPVRNEPGDLYLRPILDAICEKSQTDALIGLPDAAIPLTLSSLNKDLQLVRPLKDLESQVVWRVEPGLIVGRSRYPIEATRTRLDRAIFKDLLSRLAKGGEYRLDTFADYAARQNPDAGATDLERLGFATAQVTYETNSLSELLLGDFVGFRDTLRLYGQLSPPQKQALWAGEDVPIDRLSLPAQQTLVRRVFRRHIDFASSSVAASLPDRDAPWWLPAGIPANAVLQAKLEANPGVMVAEGNRKGFVMSLDSLALANLRQQMGEDSGFKDLSRTRFSPVTLQFLSFAIRFSPELKAETNLLDLPPLGTSPLTLAELPPDFRKRMDAWTEEYRQQRGATRTQQKVPPPEEPRA